MPTPSRRDAWIAEIRRLPEQVGRLVAGLSAEQLTTAYDAGEWTIAQNVHHLADSHMNSYIRCKLIATEERPTFKPYDQDAWALFDDAATGDLSLSLAVLTGLHARWVSFWETLPATAWNRIGIHPESGPVTLEEQLHLYARHGAGHLDQMRRVLRAGALID